MRQAVIRRLKDGEEGRGKREGLDGVELTADTLTPHAPSDGKNDGVRINVIRLHVTDRARYDPTHTAVALLAALRAVHPDSLKFVVERFDLLAAGPDVTASDRWRGRGREAIWARVGRGVGAVSGGEGEVLDLLGGHHGRRPSASMTPTRDRMAGASWLIACGRAVFPRR